MSYPNKQIDPVQLSQIFKLNLLDLKALRKKSYENPLIMKRTGMKTLQPRHSRKKNKDQSASSINKNQNSPHKIQRLETNNQKELIKSITDLRIEEKVLSKIDKKTIWIEKVQKIMGNRESSKRQFGNKMLKKYNLNSFTRKISQKHNITKSMNDISFKKEFQTLSETTKKKCETKRQKNREKLIIYSKNNQPVKRPRYAVDKKVKDKNDTLQGWGFQDFDQRSENEEILTSKLDFTLSQDKIPVKLTNNKQTINKDFSNATLY